MDVRILLLIGIAVGIVLSSGTSVMAASNVTGNNAKMAASNATGNNAKMAASNATGNNTKLEIGSAKQLEQLTSGNQLGNLSSLTTFDKTGSNQSSNQSSGGQASGKPY
jgi:hypothetical protein